MNESRAGFPQDSVPDEHLNTQWWADFMAIPEKRVAISGRPHGLDRGRVPIRDKSGLSSNQTGFEAEFWQHPVRFSAESLADFRVGFLPVAWVSSPAF